MENNLFLIGEEYYKLINKDCEIREEIKDKNEIMKAIIENPNSKKIYHIFCEPNAKDKGKETSRIKFLEIKSFPDGLFICFNSDGTVECNICELKRTPANDLLKLTKQLFAGYMHCKLFLNTLHIESDKISYRYKVFFINDRNIETEFNSLPKLPNKVIPGRQVVDKGSYDYWNEGKVYLEKNNFKFKKNIEKIQLNKKPNTNEYFNKVNL